MSPPARPAGVQVTLLPDEDLERATSQVRRHVAGGGVQYARETPEVEAALLEYVQQEADTLCNYNTRQQSGRGPGRSVFLQITSDRVSVEDAPVTLHRRSTPCCRSRNVITAAIRRWCRSADCTSPGIGMPHMRHRWNATIRVKNQEGVFVRAAREGILRLHGALILPTVPSGVTGRTVCCQISFQDVGREMAGDRMPPVRARVAIRRSSSVAAWPHA